MQSSRDGRGALRVLSEWSLWTPELHPSPPRRSEVSNGREATVGITSRAAVDVPRARVLQVVMHDDGHARGLDDEWSVEGARAKPPADREREPRAEPGQIARGEGRSRVEGAVGGVRSGVGCGAARGGRSAGIRSRCRNVGRGSRGGPPGDPLAHANVSVIVEFKGYLWVFGLFHRAWFGAVPRSGPPSGAGDQSVSGRGGSAGGTSARRRDDAVRARRTVRGSSRLETPRAWGTKGTAMERLEAMGTHFQGERAEALAFLLPIGPLSPVFSG
jgi:hypothetical protein